jgi:hypothetical protein
MKNERLISDAPFWRPNQYGQVERLEDDLRAIANGAPSWLHDDSGLGALIDSLNEARHHYEMAHGEPTTVQP